jgi:hypothetical protein
MNIWQPATGRVTTWAAVSAHSLSLGCRAAVISPMGRLLMCRRVTDAECGGTGSLSHCLKVLRVVLHRSWTLTGERSAGPATAGKAAAGLGAGTWRQATALSNSAAGLFPHACRGIDLELSLEPHDDWSTVDATEPTGPATACEGGRLAPPYRELLGAGSMPIDSA